MDTKPSLIITAVFLCLLLLAVVFLSKGQKIDKDSAKAFIQAEVAQQVKVEVARQLKIEVAKQIKELAIPPLEVHGKYVDVTVEGGVVVEEGK